MISQQSLMYTLSTGSINASTVRIYDVPAHKLVGEFTTGYVLASCMSADGMTLVLATCDSENTIEVCTCFLPEDSFP